MNFTLTPFAWTIIVIFGTIIAVLVAYIVTLLKLFSDAVSIFRRR